MFEKKKRFSFWVLSKMTLRIAILTIICFINNAIARSESSFSVDVPMENPDLLGGDMLGVESFDDKGATVDPKHLWPEGVVFYEEAPGLRNAGVMRTTIRSAMEQYETNTCIKFVKRKGQKDYVRILAGNGCYSHVGRKGGQQILSLGAGCGMVGVITHELGHALGFYHEQNRSDRDDYITIFWENIEKGFDGQFFKLKPDKNRLLTDFDYDSIMLYGSYTFSRDKARLRTMEGKDGRILREVYSKHFLSQSDIQRVNMLYNCTDIKRD